MLENSKAFDDGTPLGDRAIHRDDAFAFIIKLDPEISISVFENAENCVVFSSFSELQEALLDAGPRVLSKPVVILSAELPAAPDHLIVAVGLHWRFGGKYVLSRVRCIYSCATGTLQLSTVSEVELHRTALLPAIITMPVREALLPSSQLLLFSPSDEFTVCVPLLNISNAELKYLEHSSIAKLQSPLEFERLSRIGGLNHRLLSSLPIRSHWPVANQIVGRLTEYRQLIRNLDVESSKLSSSIADVTISLLEKLPSDIVYVPEKVGRFLLALSLRGDILQGLNVSKLRSYLNLCRQCDGADGIASNVAIAADEICQGDVGVISPLFEFLASSLSPAALNATFASCACRVSMSEDHFVALADSMRNYADETTLALLLTNVHRANPAWLRKPKALRRFKALLTSDLAPALRSQVGESTLTRIEGTLEVTERFRAAVLAADGSLARSILQEDAGFAKVNFLKWMDTLRGLSNELRDLRLRVADLNLPGIYSFPRQRLAAIIFSDDESIEDLSAAGLLNGRGELNAAARYLIGDNSMLNILINEKFAETDVIPLQINGGTAAEVFRNACLAAASREVSDGPLVSVIMSAYNPDIELMKLSLDSILKQTWKNIEVFVIDDASGDEKGREIRELVSGHANVELIRLDVNSGPYVGRNIALQRARGDFVAIQDSDDWSHPQRLSSQIEFLLGSPEARVVASEHIRIDRSGCVSLEGHFRIFGDGPMTSVFRTEIFREIGGFASVCSRGDVEMRERIAAYYGHQAVAALPLPLVLCYADFGTLSHRALAQKAPHLQLFRSNISRRPNLNDLFRDGVALTDRHRVHIPVNLRPAS